MSKVGRPEKHVFTSFFFFASLTTVAFSRTRPVKEKKGEHYDETLLLLTETPARAYLLFPLYVTHYFMFVHTRIETSQSSIHKYRLLSVKWHTVEWSLVVNAFFFFFALNLWPLGCRSALRRPYALPIFSLSLTIQRQSHKLKVNYATIL